MADWSDLSLELDRWSDQGERATFWWRDDDATAPGPRLERLVALSRSAAVPLGLAVIPGQAQEDLGPALANVPGLKMLVHGLHHDNNAPEGQKKAEFGNHRPVDDMLGEAAIGLASLMARFPDLTRPVFVPPWNRVDEQLVARLPEAQLTGLSRYGPRAHGRTADGVVENNCHLDLINWRGGRHFVGRGQALDMLIEHLCARRGEKADRDEVTGILSHHGVMDDDSWDFLGELFSRTTESDGAHWLTIDEVFRVPE